MISAGKGPARECAARTNLPRPPARDALRKEIFVHLHSCLDFFSLKKLIMVSAGIGIELQRLKLNLSCPDITSHITSHMVGFILVMLTVGLPVIRCMRKNVNILTVGMHGVHVSCHAAVRS